MEFPTDQNHSRLRSLCSKLLTQIGYTNDSYRWMWADVHFVNLIRSSLALEPYEEDTAEWLEEFQPHSYHLFLAALIATLFEKKVDVGMDEREPDIVIKKLITLLKITNSEAVFADNSI